MSVADMNDVGKDVYFFASGQSYAVHRDRQGHEIHQKQGRLRDRCRSFTISFGSSRHSVKSKTEHT